MKSLAWIKKCGYKHRQFKLGLHTKKLSYEIVSLDLKHADIINTYIRNWDHTIQQPKRFDVIWASPPCTECSRAKTTGVRNTSLAKEIVMKTLAIIDNLNPAYIILDNTPKLDFSKTNHFGKSLNVISYV